MTAMVHTVKAANEWSTWPSVSARAAARIDTEPVSSALLGRVCATIGVRRSVRLMRRDGRVWPRSEATKRSMTRWSRTSTTHATTTMSRIENGFENSRSAVSATPCESVISQHLLTDVGGIGAARLLEHGRGDLAVEHGDRPYRRRVGAEPIRSPTMATDPGVDVGSDPVLLGDRILPPAPAPAGAAAVPMPADGVGYRLKRKLLGPPLHSAELEHQRLGKPTALAVFASDNLSSSAYATEEILHALVPAVGLLAFSLVMPITGALLVMLALLILSYRETIKAYPSAGGAYLVTRDNFGIIPAQVAGAALLVGYILTVAVSVSAGTAALISQFEGLDGPCGCRSPSGSSRS